MKDPNAQLGKALVRMLEELSTRQEPLCERTKLRDLALSGLDMYDLVMAVVTLEIQHHVEVPDAFLENPDWSLARLGREIARLAKEADPLHPLRKLRMMVETASDAAQAAFVLGRLGRSESN